MNQRSPAMIIKGEGDVARVSVGLRGEAHYITGLVHYRSSYGHIVNVVFGMEKVKSVAGLVD